MGGGHEGKNDRYHGPGAGDQHLFPCAEGGTYLLYKREGP